MKQTKLRAFLSNYSILLLVGALIVSLQVDVGEIIKMGLSDANVTHITLIHAPGRPLRASLSSVACPFIERKTLQVLHDQSPVGYGQFGFAVNLTETQEVFGLHGGQTVIDLACTSKFRRAIYHRLIDCFVPSICTLQYASMLPAATLLAPSYLLDLYKYVLGGSVNRTILSYEHKRGEVYGINITSGESIELVSPKITAKIHEHHPQHLADLREMILARDPTIAQKPMHIVIIHRSCSDTRCFPNIDTIFNRFTKELNMSGVLYYGNESFKETIEIFANAQVVVGYHGAGLANAIFSPWGAIVLEYTTFHDMNATHLWRSNSAVAKMHGGLTWLRHAIDIDRLTDLDTLANSTDTDHFIKGLRDVTLTGATMYNSIQRIKEELDRAN
jgi:hypothetical protein